MGLALVGYSLPSFFIGLVLIFFVVLEWGLLPFPQWVSPTDNPVQFFQTMILPWIVIAVLNAAFYVRLTRNQVLETLGEDYVRTARAKGLRERVVVVKHALRAGLTPIVTAAGLDLAYLLGGAIVTESIFSLPGMGSLAVDSVVRSDLPVIAGCDAGQRGIHHLRQPDRRSPLRSGGSAREGGMIGRLTRTVDRISTTATEERAFLTVNNLKVAFPTEDGLVQAVDDVWSRSRKAVRSPSSVSPAQARASLRRL